MASHCFILLLFLNMAQDINHQIIIKYFYCSELVNNIFVILIHCPFLFTNKNIYVTQIYIHVQYVIYTHDCNTVRENSNYIPRFNYKDIHHHITLTKIVTPYSNICWLRKERSWDNIMRTNHDHNYMLFFMRSSCHILCVIKRSFKQQICISQVKDCEPGIVLVAHLFLFSSLESP